MKKQKKQENNLFGVYDNSLAITKEAHRKKHQVKGERISYTLLDEAQNIPSPRLKNNKKEIKKVCKKIKKQLEKIDLPILKENNFTLKKDPVNKKEYLPISNFPTFTLVKTKKGHFAIILGVRDREIKTGKKNINTFKEYILCPIDSIVTTSKTKVQAIELSEILDKFS